MCTTGITCQNSKHTERDHFIKMYYVCRYFRCAPLYGLFAPLHKVTVMGSGNPSNPPSRRGSLIRYGDFGGLACHRASSQESISSIGSTSSASRGVAGGRMRLGITSLSGQVETERML
jgi:hypothetical protein